MSTVATIPRHSQRFQQDMPKKPSGGAHKAPRVAVQIPKQFADLARILAAKKQQPTLWFLLDLIAKEAEKQKIERPALPWEEGGDI
jgi:hypothetical protein